MAYLRISRVGKAVYYYVVRSERQGSKVRTRVLEYLGRDPDPKRLGRAIESPGRTRFLSADEAKDLLEHASRHLRPIVVAALHTGARLGELLTLRWEDVDLERGMLFFDQRNCKSGRQREVPIDSVVDAMLQEKRKVTAIAGDARDYVFTRHGSRLRDVRTGSKRRAMPPI